MKNKQKESLGIRFLYHTFLGRVLLKILSCSFLSRLVGLFLSSSFSKFLIKPFSKKNHIVWDEYYCDDLKSFNDFFARKVREEARPIDKNKKHLISPSDGFISVYPINKGLVLPVKQSQYSVSSLLKNEKLALEYENGTCVVIRLCVFNYHRYCYLDNGKKGKNVFIPGKLHTVRPIALEKYSVFTENARCYTIMETEYFKKVTQVEVGALLVGKIQNYHEEYSFSRGEEKGTFLFGGSTIILLLQKDAVEIPEEYFESTKRGEEIPVKMGEKIGEVRK